MKETIKKALARNCSAKAFCVYGIFKRLEKAIDTCINQDVLADFLKKHRAEVTNMILTTYDKDLYEKTLKEDAREEGRAEIRAELNEFKLLNKCLLKAKRYNDLERATEDIEYQKKLLKELGIE